MKNIELTIEKLSLKCTACLEEIDYTWVIKCDSSLGQKYIYLCSNCETILKVSNERINRYSFPVSKDNKLKIK
jgi:DNA-directed RNA polymerase subunit RPC12/RpoP